MKRKQALLCCAGLLASQPMFAQDGALASTTIVPYIETGWSHYALEFSGNIGVFDINSKVIFDAPIIKLGLAGVWGDLFANVYYKKTGESNDSQSFDEFGIMPINWTADRDELSATAGYSVTDALSVFGGYRELNADASGNQNARYRYEHDGFFLGGSYRFDITSSGSLTASLGYAWLDFEFDFKVSDVLQWTDTDGDGDGLKGGVVWRDFFGPDMGYTLAVEYYEYNSDLSPVAERGPPISNAEISETDTLFSVGLFYVF